MSENASINPFEEIRLRTNHEVQDVQMLANILVDPDGKGLNDFWDKSASALIAGSTLHVAYVERDKSLCGVYNFIFNPLRQFDEVFETMVATKHDKVSSEEYLINKGWIDQLGRATRTHPFVAIAARDMLQRSANEKSGVLATARRYLEMYRFPTF